MTHSKIISNQSNNKFKFNEKVEKVVKALGRLVTTSGKTHSGKTPTKIDLVALNVLGKNTGPVQELLEIVTLKVVKIVSEEVIERKQAGSVLIFDQKKTESEKTQSAWVKEFPKISQAPGLSRIPEETSSEELRDNTSNKLLTPVSQKKEPIEPRYMQFVYKELRDDTSNKLLTPVSQKKEPIEPRYMQFVYKELRDDTSNKLLTPVSQKKEPHRDSNDPIIYEEVIEEDIYEEIPGNSNEPHRDSNESTPPPINMATHPSVGRKENWYEYPTSMGRKESLYECPREKPVPVPTKKSGILAKFKRKIKSKFWQSKQDTDIVYDDGFFTRLLTKEELLPRKTDEQHYCDPNCIVPVK